MIFHIALLLFFDIFMVLDLRKRVKSENHVFASLLDACIIAERIELLGPSIKRLSQLVEEVYGDNSIYAMERRYDLIETKENSVMNMLQKATDKDMRRLKAEHRQALYALLKPREGSPDLCCTVLETILRMKDIEALPYLESALSGPVPFPSFARQLEAGIVVLREEKLRLQQSGTLLRASEPPISADTLLIPVMTQPGSTPPEELLRPEIAPKSQGK